MICFQTFCENVFCRMSKKKETNAKTRKKREKTEMSPLFLKSLKILKRISLDNHAAKNIDRNFYV